VLARSGHVILRHKFTLAEKEVIRVGARRWLVYREESNSARSAYTDVGKYGPEADRAVGGSDGVFLTLRALATLQHGGGPGIRQNPAQCRETMPLHVGNGPRLDSIVLTISIFRERPTHRCDGGPLQQ